MVQDFLSDENGDLLIFDGDFVIGPSDDQHNEIVMVASPGLVRFSPITGVAIFRKMKSRMTLADADELRQDAILQLQVDGCTSVNISINSTIDLNVDGTR
jgi:hypothetical protein